jgi:hypothetical protein
MVDSELIARLKFIGTIQAGDKVNVKLLQLQRDCLYTKISRSFFNIDDRDNTLLFIQSIITKSFELLTSQLEDEMNYLNNIQCTNLINDIVKSVDCIKFI